MDLDLPHYEWGRCGGGGLTSPVFVVRRLQWLYSHILPFYPRSRISLILQRHLRYPTRFIFVSSSDHTKCPFGPPRPWHQKDSSLHNILVLRRHFLRRLRFFRNPLRDSSLSHCLSYWIDERSCLPRSPLREAGASLLHDSGDLPRRASFIRGEGGQDP